MKYDTPQGDSAFESPSHRSIVYRFQIRPTLLPSRKLALLIVRDEYTPGISENLYLPTLGTHLTCTLSNEQEATCMLQ